MVEKQGWALEEGINLSGNRHHIHVLPLVGMRFFLFFSALLSIRAISFAQGGFSPAKESLKLFNRYVPAIEKNNNALVDNPTAITGDINGDQKEDCIVFFVLTSKEGGNLIMDRQSAIYLNTGAGMKVVVAFPPLDFCYRIDHIKDQVIYAKEYKCMPPYNEVTGERKFIYKDGEIRQLQ